MSIKKMTEIWELDLPQSEKLVALAFADHADDEGRCWPSFQRVAHKTGYSRRQVIRICRSLKARGILERIRQATADMPSVYRIDPSRGVKLSPLSISSSDILSLPLDGIGVSNCHLVTSDGGGSDTGVTGVVTQLCHPNHQLTINNHHKDNIGRQAGRFREFWLAYPKKVKKRPAYNLWVNKKLDAICDALLDDIKTRLQEDGRWRSGFIPDPTTYLSQERWNDELSELRS